MFDNILKNTLYNKLIKKLNNISSNKNITYPTKQGRNGLVKFFFMNRYLWNKGNIEKDSSKYCGGFRSDVEDAPKFLLALQKYLFDLGYIDFIGDILVMNEYNFNEKNPSINAHLDKGFSSNIVSYSLLSDTRLSFKFELAGYGHHGGYFCIPLLKNSINKLIKNSWCYTNIKHMILCKDIIDNRKVLLFRQIKPIFKKQCINLKKYREKKINEIFDKNIIEKNNFYQLKIEYCKKKKIKMSQFYDILYV